MRPMLHIKKDRDLSALKQYIGSGRSYGIITAELGGEYYVTTVATMVAVEIWSIWFGEHPNQMTHQEMCDELNKDNVKIVNDQSGPSLQFEVTYPFD